MNTTAKFLAYDASFSTHEADLLLEKLAILDAAVNGLISLYSQYEGDNSLTTIGVNCALRDLTEMAKRLIREINRRKNEVLQ